MTPDRNIDSGGGAELGHADRVASFLFVPPNNPQTSRFFIGCRPCPLETCSAWSGVRIDVTTDSSADYAVTARRDEW
jgi:hypothetical protein